MFTARFHFRFLITCSALLAGGAATGGTIYWNMNDLSAPTSIDVASLAVGAITQGNTTTTGGTSSSASGGYQFNLGGTVTPASGGTNLTFSAKAGVFNSGSSSYVAVTLTSNAGYIGTLSAIGFGTRSTPSGPTTLLLRSSTDSFAGDIASFSTSTDSSWVYLSSVLSSPLSFSSSSGLTLRLYGSGGSTAAAGNWRIDDLQLDVAVVPEPTAIVLALLGAGGRILAMRRVSRYRWEGNTRCAAPTPASASSNC